MKREPELLDIKQAAALLQVSEASLRRWTNDGRLASFRVGGRKERRFRRADLLAFLESSPGQASVEGKAVGTHTAHHLCGFYTTDLGRIRLTARFLLEGLSTGAMCVLVCAPDVRDHVLGVVQRERPTAPREIEAGRLVHSEYRETGASQVESWDALGKDAMARGERLLWAVGDVSGGRIAQRGTIDDVLAYEAEYERVMSRFPITTLCLYDARILSGVDASRLLQDHPHALTHTVDQLVN